MIQVQTPDKLYTVNSEILILEHHLYFKSTEGTSQIIPLLNNRVRIVEMKAELNPDVVYNTNRKKQRDSFLKSLMEDETIGNSDETVLDWGKIE